MESTPLASIVTPSYNSSKYIEDTIESIIEQSYEEVEHIIVDGGSTDGTIKNIQKYKGEYDLTLISEPDNGMYDAIEKGFNRASGEIFAWLNSDDMYLPWAIEVAVNHLKQDDTEWIIGHPANWNENGVLHYVNPLQPRYRREWIKKGWYHGDALGWMQQESMFWTAELWEQKGGFPEGIELAGDYYLWRQFAEKAELKQVGTVVAGFRDHSDQLTSDMEKYRSEIPDTGLTPKLISSLYLQNLYSLYFILKEYTK
jgi:glycosyltransferase involved in cell wall biosynthesis